MDVRYGLLIYHVITNQGDMHHVVGLFQIE
jgi:hypothetical protein